MSGQDADRQPLDPLAMLAEQRPEVLEGIARESGDIGALGEAILTRGERE